jgi:hypothetical protein
MLPRRGGAGTRPRTYDAAAARLMQVTQGDKDYSSTPLPKKLGVREGSRVLLVSAPEEFPDRLRPMPPGASIVSRASRDLDVIVVFATATRELERRFPKLVASLAPDGRLWVAWPKKVSGVPTDVTFEDAQSLGLAAGLVDNKSGSITDVFQGLQFVVRLKDRPR